MITDDGTKYIYTTGMPGGFYKTRHEAVGKLAIHMRVDRFSNPYYAASQVNPIPVNHDKDN